MSIMSDKAQAMHRDIAHYLKQLRQHKGMTMRQLSDVLGTPHSFIGKLESRGRRLDIAEFVLYCEGLNENPLEVFADMVKATNPAQ